MKKRHKTKRLPISQVGRSHLITSTIFYRACLFLKMLSRGNVRFILIEACSLSFPLLVSRLSCRAQGTATVTVLILILQVGTIQPLEYLYLQQVTAGPDGFGILFPLKTSGFSF